MNCNNIVGFRTNVAISGNAREWSNELQYSVHYLKGAYPKRRSTESVPDYN